MKKLSTFFTIISLFTLSLNAQYLPQDIEKRIKKSLSTNNISHDRGNIFLLDKIATDFYNGTTITQKDRTSFTYDKFGNEISSLTETYNSTTMTWTEKAKSVSTYDANNNNLSFISHTYDAANKKWNNQATSFSTYNSDNTIKSSRYVLYSPTQPDSTYRESDFTFFTMQIKY